jgi:hypothetical protein
VLGICLLLLVCRLPAATAFSATGLPPGLALDPATGRISGRPVEAGDHTIQLTAANSAGPTTLALRLRVVPFQP